MISKMEGYLQLAREIRVSDFVSTVRQTLSGIYTHSFLFSLMPCSCAHLLTDEPCSVRIGYGFTTVFSGSVRWRSGFLRSPTRGSSTSAMANSSSTPRDTGGCRY